MGSGDDPSVPEAEIHPGSSGLSNGEETVTGRVTDKDAAFLMSKCMPGAAGTCNRTWKSRSNADEWEGRGHSGWRHLFMKPAEVEECQDVWRRTTFSTLLPA